MCNAWLWKCPKCGHEHEQVFDPCGHEGIPAHKCYIVDRPKNFKAPKCRKCSGGYYVSRTYEEVDKDSSKPKRRSQPLTFIQPESLGYYEGIRQKSTIVEKVHDRPPGEDNEEDAAEPFDDPETKKSKRSHGHKKKRRSGREGEAEVDAPEAVLVEEFDQDRSPQPSVEEAD